LRFLCDGMLGKLTRWLRILGHDVEYSNNLDDEELIALSRSEDRILLTRDVELYRRALTRGGKAFLVRGGNEAERLAELASRFNLKLEVDASTSRCPKCNARIKPVKKDEVLEKVPESTSRLYDEFWICLGCGQVYWRGSHWRRINETLEKSKQMVSSGFSVGDSQTDSR